MDNEFNYYNLSQGKTGEINNNGVKNLNYENYPKSQPPSYKNDNRSKKVKTTSKITISLMAIISAILIGVTEVGYISDVLGISDSAPVTVSISLEVSTWESGVAYYVDLQDYVPKKPITVTVKNYFTNRTQTFDVNAEDYETISGYEDNLAKNMSYTVYVKEGDVTLATKSIKTETRYEKN